MSNAKGFPNKTRLVLASFDIIASFRTEANAIAREREFYFTNHRVTEKPSDTEEDDQV